MRRILIFSIPIFTLLSFVPIDDFLVISIQKFNDYVKVNPIVSVQLVYNQNKYSAGDTIFFKSFFLTSDFRAVNGKQILEAEIRDEKDNVINQISYRVIDGIGENQIVIPSGTRPGKFKLVSYSQWMKNFDAKYFFSKSFLVVARFQLEAIKREKDDLVSAFPEGGMLIAGIVNSILIKSSASSNFKIKDSQGKVISSGSTDANGIALAKISPNEFATYFVESATKSIALGNVKSDGVALELQSTDGNVNQADIKLRINKNSIFKETPLYFIGTAKNRVTFSRIILFSTNDSIVVNIPPKAVEEGLNQAFLIDAQGNTISERIFWINPRPVNVSLQMDKWNSSNRSKCLIEATLQDETATSLMGDAAVSVTNKSLFDDDFSLFSNEILLADLPELRDEMQENKVLQADWSNHANDYLIGYTWNRIPWKGIVTEKWPKPTYKFQYSLGLKGRATYSISREPLPDSSKLTIYLQNHKAGYELYVQKNGYFELPAMYDFWDFDNLFYVADIDNKETKNQIRIDIDVDQDKSGSTSFSKQGERLDSYGDFKLKKEAIDNSYNFYLTENKPKKAINSNEEFEDEFGGVDWQIKVDEYIVFPTMEELIHELLSFIKFRKKSNEGSIRMVLVDNGQNKYASGDPLFIIDGSMTKDMTFFLSLKPKDIRSVKVIRDKAKLARLGGIAKNGVLLIQTKSESLTTQLKQNKTIVRGLSRQTPFFQIQYAQPSNLRLPDFRSTVEWNSDIKFNDSGKAIIKFFSSDDIGELELNVRGITKEGRPFSARKIIKSTFKY